MAEEKKELTEPAIPAEPPPASVAWTFYPGAWQLDIPATPHQKGLSVRIALVEFEELTPEELAPPAEGPAHELYTVAAGDSWWRIATNHGLTVAELKEANEDAVGKSLHPGQQLIIPRKKPS